MTSLRFGNKTRPRERLEFEIAARIGSPYKSLLGDTIPSVTVALTIRALRSTKGVYDLAKNTHLRFTQGAGHGGSHPHLAHGFIKALVEDREPFPNARMARPEILLVQSVGKTYRSERSEALEALPTFRSAFHVAVLSASLAPQVVRP